jgi:hypothetical protein
MWLNMMRSASFPDSRPFLPTLQIVLLAHTNFLPYVVLIIFLDLGWIKGLGWEITTTVVFLFADALIFYWG